MKMVVLFFFAPYISKSAYLSTKISLNNPVHLSTIKATEELKNLAIIKQPRLSVSPLNQEEFNKIIELSNTSFTL